MIPPTAFLTDPFRIAVPLHHPAHAVIIIADNVADVFRVFALFQNDVRNRGKFPEKARLFLFVQKNTERTMGNDQRIQIAEQRKIIDRIKLIFKLTANRRICQIMIKPLFCIPGNISRFTGYSAAAA